MQCAHDIALIAHMVARQDLTGQGIEPVCQSRQQLFCTLNVHRLPPLYGIAARSRPQQTLVKGEQRFVDRKNIVVPLSDKILNNDVEFAAGTEGIARAGKQVLRLLQIQLKRNGKGERRRLWRACSSGYSDLREQLAVHVGLL